MLSISIYHPLFTIGYSSHTQESLLDVLKKYGISALADVRSQPFSKYKPEFNREVLSTFLTKNGVHYVFLGDECGARIKAPECYVKGKADYKLIAKHPMFVHGLARIKYGLLSQTIALMCAEKDPLGCHRTILVCRNLRNENINISHILSDGAIESQKDTEHRLLKLFHLDLPDLLKNDEIKLNEAYDLQGESIAYIATSDTDYKEEVSAENDKSLFDRFHKKISS